MAASKIKMLSAKNNAILDRVKRLHDSITPGTATKDLRPSETFMAETETLSVISAFTDNLDKIIILFLDTIPNYSANYDILNAFEQMYARIQRNRSQIIKNATPHTSDGSGKGANTPPQIKLPPIDIPSFDGKVDNWPVFYECFKANVHTNVNLTDAQPFHYLMGKLTASALKITAGIIPSGDNYQSI